MSISAACSSYRSSVWLAEELGFIQLLCLARNDQILHSSIAIGQEGHQLLPHSHFRQCQFDERSIGQSLSHIIARCGRSVQAFARQGRCQRLDLYAWPVTSPIEGAPVAASDVGGALLAPIALLVGALPALECTRRQTLALHR